MRPIVSLGTIAVLALVARSAAAEEPPVPAEVERGIVQTDEASTPTAPAPVAPDTVAEAIPEAPPPPPRHKGFVLESTLGAAGFLGEFRHVAPPGWWLRTQFGYEFFNWFMLFAEGELLYTDTSASQDASKVRAFPIFGFGGGMRVTIHPTDRFAFYVQGSIDALKADVSKNALTIVGFHDAESFNPSFGGRIGLEWYQIDRHLALGLTGGLRDATGFAKFAATSETPLLWDAGASLRYTF